MRCGMISIAVLAALSAIAVSPSGARADDEWCGYTAQAKSIVECGYSTMAQCETATGKGGMCFIDPDYAQQLRRAAPIFRPRHLVQPS